MKVSKRRQSLTCEIEGLASPAEVGKQCLRLLLGFLLLTASQLATLPAQAQFEFVTNGNSVTITGYAGQGSRISLPATLNGLPVTRLGNGAFQSHWSLTNVVIPNSVTNIGEAAFYGCAGLTRVTLGNRVTDIKNEAFCDCSGLTHVTIPASVVRISYKAFGDCTNLQGVFFAGATAYFAANVFADDAGLTLYYLPNALIWGLGGFATAVWNPRVQVGAPGDDEIAHGFELRISGTVNLPFLLEACTNLLHPAWVPLESGTLTNGSFSFNDLDATNHPARYYRVRSP